MDNLPIDTRSPAVRDYLSLIRLQMLTPLSLLINISATAVCAFVVQPSLGRVSQMFPTSISPKPSMIIVYVVAIFAGQIGYCILLVLARKQETKQALIKASGISLVLANWAMGLWAITWTLQFFTVAAIILGILTILLLYSNIVLLIYHPPVSSRPLDTALIHAPLRLFLILPLMLTLPHTIFIAVGHYWEPGRPQDYSKYEWEGFGVMFGVNLLGLIVIALRRDIVWCVGAMWICASVWSQRPKSTPVQATVIAFTVLHPLVLVFSTFLNWLRSRREGAIALPPDEVDRAHNLNNQHDTERHQQNGRGVAAVWG